MKNEFRRLCVIALTVIVGSGGIPAVAQERQTEPTPRADAARVSVERERAAQEKTRTPEMERMYFERDVITHPPAQGDYVFLATEMSSAACWSRARPIRPRPSPKARRL